jgi:hypothetical protein
MAIEPRLGLIELFRFDVVAQLSFTFHDDLCRPVRYFIAIASAPCAAKDAISLGLLAGELHRRAGGLDGRLELTAAGRFLVRRFRARGMVDITRSA